MPKFIRGNFVLIPSLSRRGYRHRLEAAAVEPRQGGLEVLPEIPFCFEVRDLIGLLLHESADPITPDLNVIATGAFLAPNRSSLIS